MQLYSTNNKDLRVPFKEAVFNSLPADKGLYMPETIPTLDAHFIQHLSRFSFQDIAFKVASALIGDAIPAADLRRIIDDAIDFDAPVRPLDSGMAVLELFHGPSLAFKDFGARFMSRVMAALSQADDRVLDVLVATSGDTGGAVALGFLGVPGTRVTILYPKGKVSPIQELQLTTNGQNIHAIEVDGTFDDCQALVKEAFNDPELKAALRLTSANSINIARLIPQTFYYFYAYAQLQAQGIRDVVFSVPSGNFGNIGAGLLAYKMGLPVKHFIAATNVNDTVPRFLHDGRYEPRPSVQTLANAMDVGNPSNWVRIMDMFDNDREALKRLVSSYTVTDAETRGAIQTLFDRYGYVACPHTAIAWLAAEHYRQEHPGTYASVFLSTAHPCKFPEVFTEELTAKIALPVQVDGLKDRKKEAMALDVDFGAFKRYLLGGR
ncbi:threonine synthase [Parapedobacter sp. 10938]|uniref:threonine synthase n=1 Tax=Parapedobacter flavus TaxID=3110225 RepID=UPI002DB937D7|nr:threonine synthase [Parapedobacter sp. 10938]MEC3881586.1 threonine synthase [Parapedobacter sp. 10938]